MESRLVALMLVVPILAAPAMGQPKKGGRSELPKAMIGVWGEKPESCQGEPNESNERVEIEKDGVGDFVSIYGVRNWQRQGDKYSARATLAEEGEGKPTPGRYPVALRLQKDGKLEIKIDRREARLYVKCPAGTNVR